jgi:hypothetical protein
VPVLVVAVEYLYLMDLTLLLMLVETASQVVAEV